MPDDRRLRLPFAVFLLAWLALCAPWLWGDVTIPYDAKAHFQPQLAFLANALHTGQLPFWNPHVFAGSPQIADPQSLIMSPALFLAALGPTPGFRVLDSYALALLGLAALAIICLFRERGWHPAGGIVAALGLAFGASAAWRLQHIGQIQSLALFAIALWLLHRLLVRRTITSALLAGVACGLLLVEPNQVALLAAYVLAAYATAHVLGHVLGQPARISAIRGHLPSLTIAAVTALAIAIVPLLLLAQFAATTSRPAVAMEEAARGSLHPASLLTLLIGDLYAAGTTGVDYWGPYSASWDPTNLTLSQNMSQLYLGALPALAILVMGFARGLAWRREIRVVTLAALAMIVYALGNYTPAFALVYDIVPGVDLFRRPADATFMIGALAAILAGYLVHCLASGSAGSADRSWRRGEVCLVAAVFVTAVAVAVREGAFDKAISPLLVSAGIVAAAAAALWSMRQSEVRAARFSVPLLASLMVVDLAAVNGPNESTALPARQYDVLRPATANPTIALLRQHLQQPTGSPRRDRVEMAGVGFDWPNAGMVHGFDHTLGYNPLRLDIVTRALGADDTVAGWDQRRFTPLFPSYRSILADMMGLRYLVSSVPAERIDPTLKPGDLRLIARTTDAYVYENPRALPRVMLVPDWQPADFEMIVHSGQWPAGFDPRRTVLLEDPPGTAGHTTAAPAQAGSPVRIELESYRNTQVGITVESTDGGLLVLADVWHPWWRASVNGTPVPILKANVMFRAVAVPPGRHRVEFTFHPFAGALHDLLHGRAHPRS